MLFSPQATLFVRSWPSCWYSEMLARIYIFWIVKEAVFFFRLLQDTGSKELLILATVSTAFSLLMVSFLILIMQEQTNIR